MSTIGIGWQIGVPSGWGTYGVNLAYELVRLNRTPEIFFTVPRPTLTAAQAEALGPHLSRQPANHSRFRAGPVRVPGPMLHALGDKLAFPEELAGLSGAQEFGVVFFESATIPAANLEIARRFQAIVAGSSWNGDVLKAHGVGDIHVCLQGVDLDVFRPGPRHGAFAGRFAVFSGGKLEYRKGQDLVVAAFKKFHARYPDSILITAWHSPWPVAAKSLATSAHVTAPPMQDASGRLDISRWVVDNGIPASAHVDLGRLDNLSMAEQLREVDVALLPSRAEGGTNLVAMECMACGVPTILSHNTGHRDLIRDGNSFPLNFQIPMGAVTRRPDLEGWGESSIDEIVTTLERVYTDSSARKVCGASGAQFMQNWGWQTQIAKLAAVLNL